MLVALAWLHPPSTFVDFTFNDLDSSAATVEFRLTDPEHLRRSQQLLNPD
jgi:hypothetical protein